MRPAEPLFGLLLAPQHSKPEKIIKAASISANHDRAGAQAIRRMVKIADAFALPDNVVLLPRLRALAAKGVVALRLTDRKEKADAE